MLILGNFESLRHQLIPALFRIAEDHAIVHIDIIAAPREADLTRVMDSPLSFVAFEFYRDNESFFRRLPESIRDRIIVLAKPADFPSIAPEIKCACFCTKLKALLPREGAGLLDHGSGRQPDASEPAPLMDEPSGKAT
jgi:hypothetical protein